MQFSINSTILFDKLQPLMKATDTKSVNPLIECVKLQVSNSILTMTTTDLSLTMISSSDVTDTTDGMTLVPAKTLVALLKNINNETLHFATKDNDMIMISWITGESSLPTMNPNDYPQISQPEGISYEMEAKQLIDAFNIAKDSIVFNELHPIMNGLCMDCKDSTINIVGTDSHELITITIPAPNNTIAGKQYVIPTKMVTAITSLQKVSEEKLTLVLGDKKITMTLNDMTITGTLTAGKYPAYESVIPKEYTTEVTINRNEIISSIRQANITSDRRTNIVTIKVKNDKIEIVSADKERQTSSVEKIEMNSFCGNEGNFNFRASALLGLLNRIPAKEIKMSFNEGKKPLLLTPTDNDTNIKAILLPIII